MLDKHDSPGSIPGLRTIRVLHRDEPTLRLMPAYPHPLVALVVDVFEEGAAYPIVRHEFIGKTRQEAEGYFRAHQKTDTFLAGCLEGRFKNIRCRATMYWKRLQ